MAAPAVLRSQFAIAAAGDRRHVFAAAMAPAELDVGDVALMAVRLTEILTELGDGLSSSLGRSSDSQSRPLSVK
jgi:hypothetical protein